MSNWEQDKQRAGQLMELLQDEGTDPETKEEIRAWFWSDASPDAKDVAMAEYFAAMQWNTEPETRLKAKPDIRPAVPKPAPRRRLSRVALRVAAVLIPAMALLGGAYLWIERAGETAGEHPVANVSLSTSAHGQKRIVLPDGSQVWINSSSEISYNDDFSRERFVTLSGEAFFSVVRNTARPFRVRAGEMTVEVLGTEFNIRTYPNEPTAEVILASGSVQVITPKGKPVVLEPDQRLTLDTKSLEAIVDRVRADTVSTWRVTDLHFIDTPTREAIERIGIYYGREVSMPGWKPTGDLINLDLDHELPLEHVLEIVRGITGNFTYLITDNEIIITQIP